MSDSHPNGDAVQVPALVELTSYAILGGAAGKPVSVTFRDFSPDLVSALWNYFDRSIGPAHVAQVWSQTDVRLVERQLGQLRLVLVYPGQAKVRMSNVLEWMVENRRGGEQGLPSIFSVHHDASSETPGSTLVANGTPVVVQEVLNWLHAQESGECNPLLSGGWRGESWPVVVCDRLIRAVHRAHADGESLSLRDRRIVEGLVSGARLYRTIKSSTENGQAVEDRLEAHPDDYATIRNLLTKPFLQNVHAPADDLTKVMVSRANLFLEMGANGSPSTAAPLGARRGMVSTVDQSAQTHKQRSLSRNELADLGNPRSPILKDLIGKVVARHDGTLLDRLGLLSPEELVGRRVVEVLDKVTTWTYKKVRTRFERLRKEGLIEVKRKRPAECVLWGVVT